MWWVRANYHWGLQLGDHGVIRKKEPQPQRTHGAELSFLSGLPTSLSDKYNPLFHSSHCYYGLSYCEQIPYYFPHVALFTPLIKAKIG